MKNLLFIFAASAILLYSCEGIWPDCLDGNGVVTTETRDVSSFTGVQSNGDFEVYIYPGEETGVLVEADENLMDLIITRVSGSDLIIETRRGNCIRSSEVIRITVRVPELSHIDLNGSGKIYCDSLSSGSFSTELDGSGAIYFDYVAVTDMDIELNGSGNISMYGAYSSVDAVIDGSGEINLSGVSPTTDYLINGSGNIRADNLATDTCYASITGSGNIYARVKDLLEVDITGSGIVYYYGDNPAVNTKISGTGQVKKMN